MKNAQKYYTFRRNQEYFGLNSGIGKGTIMHAPSIAKRRFGRVI